MANFCSECGAQVDPTEKFCSVCGHPLRQTGTPPPQQPVYVDNRPIHEQLQGRREKHKSMAIAYLLTIFLTGLGHVYIRQVRKGLAIFFGLVILEGFGFYFLTSPLGGAYYNDAQLIFLVSAVIWIICMVELYSQVRNYNRYADEHGRAPW